MAELPDRDALVEAVAGAWRPRDPHGRIESHPAWHDLDDEGRRVAHEAACEERVLEAALDPRGPSSSSRAVLARLRHG